MNTTQLPRLGSATGRWIVLATVLGSSVAALDATVVNIALPRIGESLQTGVSGLQWVLSGYTLTLASFILLGGSLGDRLGRRRVFVWGTIGFAVASVLCGAAVNIEMLVLARVLQGVAGALLTPGSLALISSSIDERDQGAAIGLWSGFGGIAGALGPFLGGWLIEVAGWRSIFLINLPLAAVVVAVSVRHVPESRDPGASDRLDVPGAVVVALGLGALTFGLIQGMPLVSVAGLILLGVFVVVEMRSDHPLVPPALFTGAPVARGDAAEAHRDPRSGRVFTAANLVTLAVYAALGGVFFLLVLQLQQVAGYSPLFSGIATLPVTVLMLALSAPAGRWAQRHGPRLPMTAGPLLAAAGVLLLLRIGPDSASAAGYVRDVLPGVLVFGLGLSALVAPLTGAVLGAVPASEAGIASGVNNAVARTAQLLAVAALPGLAGISGSIQDAAVIDQGFTIAMRICVGLLIAGALIAAALLGAPRRKPAERATVDCLPSCAAVSGPAVQPTIVRE
ncbi:EmrB/QacA subfamily drug resistance transporter [Nocardia transvalensis]|uniref:EmrB/QacA subfamily drug resistance transporter n=1 Tax=Nocardia transvalensis TaxID=37333 RepID=A0A7W9PCT9_9NOCA|nr:MFS transporter [Nocardia transvalensis]MBB5913811.1 EmrB/QacA subfamily drug resistance transporter [Nocardia transvalensis]